MSPGVAGAADVDEAAFLLPADVPDAVTGFDKDAADDDAPSLLGLPDPSNESRLSRKDSTSSRCERDPAVFVDGVPRRDIVSVHGRIAKCIKCVVVSPCVNVDQGCIPL